MFKSGKNVIRCKKERIYFSENSWSKKISKFSIHHQIYLNCQGNKLNELNR